MIWLYLILGWALLDLLIVWGFSRLPRGGDVYLIGHDASEDPTDLARRVADRLWMESAIRRATGRSVIIHAPAGFLASEDFHAN